MEFPPTLGSRETILLQPKVNYSKHDIPQKLEEFYLMVQVLFFILSAKGHSASNKYISLDSKEEQSQDNI